MLQTSKSTMKQSSFYPQSQLISPAPCVFFQRYSMHIQLITPEHMYIYYTYIYPYLPMTLSQKSSHINTQTASSFDSFY